MRGGRVRYATRGGGVGSLLLGLYDGEGPLDHVGFTSGLEATARKRLDKLPRQCTFDQLATEGRSSLRLLR